LLDQEKMQIYVTGSSAKILAKEIASSLRGRTLVQEVFPFSFGEYLKKFEVRIPKQRGRRAELNLCII
jgi:predicted AAA+ superfamily ATPase